jgi:hypothetical protein
VNEQIEHLRLDVDDRSGAPQFVPRDIDLEVGEAEMQGSPSRLARGYRRGSDDFTIIGAFGAVPYTTFRKCSRKARVKRHALVLVLEYCLETVAREQVASSAMSMD